MLLLPGLAACGGGGGGGGGSPPLPPITGFRISVADPRDGEIYVPVDKVIRLTFSAPIYPSSLGATRFVLAERVSGTSVPGDIEYESGDRVAVYRPRIRLTHNYRYRISVSAGVQSVGGDRLLADFVAYFRTAVSDDPTPPPPPPSPKGTFRKVGDMKRGRSNHTATLLDSGRVLVTGGFNTATTLTKTAEIFDPGALAFAYTGSDMETPRAFHAAVRLSDGRVLVAGGVTGAGLVETGTAELYNPSADSFAPTGGSMTAARAFHTTTLLADGRVLIAGGTVPSPDGSFSSRKAEVFNPATGTFSTLPDMAVYRAGHTATLLTDGRVVLVGGNSSDKRIEVFSPGSDSFSTIGAGLKLARRGHTSTLLADGTILIMGGGDRTAEILETGGNVRWAPSYPYYDRKDHTDTLLPTGHVFFTGGSFLVNSYLYFQQTTEMYDPSTGAFMGTTPQMAEPRVRHRAVAYEAKKILLTGGQNADPSQPELSSAEVYELE
jgi:hypothetical protein